MKTFVILMMASVLSVGCSCTMLDKALRAAGANRAELEKVLDYYSDDSLRYEAAVFLIENMPGHKCLAGEAVNDYYAEIQCVLRDKSLDCTGKMDSLNRIADMFPKMDDVVRNDIEVITADYLIHNIDDAFRQWRSPVARHLTFGQFCEWLLPY